MCVEVALPPPKKINGLWEIEPLPVKAISAAVNDGRTGVGIDRGKDHLKRVLLNEHAARTADDIGIINVVIADREKGGAIEHDGTVNGLTGREGIADQLPPFSKVMVLPVKLAMD